tara:strand:+ start:78275 stop:78571 length:297 start_codon:yes stop_codon:yes gene_type:complete
MNTLLELEVKAMQHIQARNRHHVYLDTLVMPDGYRLVNYSHTGHADFSIHKDHGIESFIGVEFRILNQQIFILETKGTATKVGGYILLEEFKRLNGIA